MNSSQTSATRHRLTHSNRSVGTTKGIRKSSPSQGYTSHTAERANDAQAGFEKGFVQSAVKPRSGAEMQRLKSLQVQRTTEERYGGVAPLIEHSGESALDGFCFTLTPNESVAIMNNIKVSFDHLKEFQKFLSGQGCDLAKVLEFAKKWKNAQAGPRLKNVPDYAVVNKQIDALLEAGNRITFKHSTVDFKNKETVPAEGDIAQQGHGVITNPASRSGIGKGGASLAIQKVHGEAFIKPQTDLYKRNTNWVGNAHVGDAYVVHEQGAQTVISVSGPNLVHHTGLRVKIPRLSHVLNKNHVSKRQEMKLRSAYQTSFAAFDKNNQHLEEAGQSKETLLHLVPISANIFGYPAKEAAKVMVQESLRYLAAHPDISIQFLAVSAPGNTAVADQIKLQLQAFDPAIKFKELKGVPKPPKV